MNLPSVNALLGLAGVDDDETSRAVRAGRLFEIPMILLALWIVVEWYLEAKGLFPRSVTRISDWIIWLFFLIETTVLASLVRDRWRYLQTNWLNLAIILLGLPIIWGGGYLAAGLRSLRLLLILPLLLTVSSTIRQVLARNHVGITLLVSGVIAMMAGILLAGIDPGVESIWDGIWWAWVTVTTVGYGDVVPESAEGRLLGAILILLGVGLFSLLTANFSAFFISREEEQIKEAEEMIRRQEEAAMSRLVRIEKRLERLERTLERIETRLSRKRG